jgi:hypothetical protein
MRASDILHGLADLLSGIEGRSQAPAVPQQPQSVTMVQVSADNTDHSDGGTFVPPLQAKIELLKKSVGVDSVYDQQGPGEQLTGHGADNQDELARMKQMAGINPVTLDSAAEDEPLDV